MTYTKQRSFGPRKYNARRPNYQKKRSGGRSKQYIHPSKFINKSTVELKAAPIEAPKHKFADFAFTKILADNLDSAGYVQPSAIQDKTIPLALEGRDVIGLANTGTGKTAAFLLPILQKLSHSRETQSVLIMAPTRELAQQIDIEFKKFSAGMKLYSAICVGGVNINAQLRDLRRNPHIIIGTPGRLKDHISRGTIRLTSITTLVLDEADRMLDMGFVNDIRDIARQLPAERQTLCFSATMNAAVKTITQDFMNSPELVSVVISETNDHIYQDIVHYTDDAHKKDVLTNLLQQDDFGKVIVFGETKFGVQRLSDKLTKDGIASSAIHGNKSQGQRNRALNDFKAHKVKVLVATDVAARGLDIPNVSHVINFDTPQSYDDYVHRIGRTGRGGKSGVALTFIKAG